MGTLPWASGGGSGDGTEVGVLLDDEWVPREDRNPTPGVSCMLPLGLEAPGGTRKEDQLGTGAGLSKMGTGATGGTKEHPPCGTSLNQVLGRTRAYENSI